MAKYTTTIRHLIDNNFDFGLKDYPIFDENYRSSLNQKILNYYYMYEIGFETPALFKHYLNNKMDIIMPKYNALYNIQTDELLKNPLGNVNLTETMDKDTSSKSEGSSTANASGNSKSTELYQDTPQGQLDKTDIDNQTWATNLTQNKGNTSSTSSTNGNTSGTGTEDYIKKIIGNNGKYYVYDVYLKYVRNFETIDKEIINELEDLFMGVL